jgi:LPPG:FO 2-phospho-L-lactate transferase
MMDLKIVAFAGGVGGAKLADGLARIVQPEQLTVIVNTGDDFEYLGLKISPDLDTVCYTLAGLANPSTGWGRAGETWNALESLALLGGPTWFRLGDQDLGTHLERTRRLNAGQTLTQVTHAFCCAWGISATILPMSDDPVPTMVITEEGELAFQDYFVHRQCHPEVTGFRFEGVDRARPAEGVVTALSNSEGIVFCPSNPWVSLDPILALPGIRQTLAARRAEVHVPVIAVSPIIGGHTVKGPAAKMYAELGFTPSAMAVARHYYDLLDGFVIDQEDAHLAPLIEVKGGPKVLITNTLMRVPDDRKRLAEEIINFTEVLRA